MVVVGVDVVTAPTMRNGERRSPTMIVCRILYWLSVLLLGLFRVGVFSLTKCPVHGYKGT